MEIKREVCLISDEPKAVYRVHEKTPIAHIIISVSKSKIMVQVFTFIEIEIVKLLKILKAIHEDFIKEFRVNENVEVTGLVL